MFKGLKVECTSVGDTLYQLAIVMVPLTIHIGVSSLQLVFLTLGKSKWNVRCVKHEKNAIFMKNGKTLISVGNQKFSSSRIMKRTSPLNSSHEI